jgi:predicted Rossmann fold nucleotide-binding protein DprA/Smf involved in DNA uptake
MSKMTLPSLQLNPDTQAILLLCGYLSSRHKEDIKPLSLTEYNSLASWLNQRGMRPGDLLTPSGQSELQAWQEQKVSLERLKGLLGRGVAFGLALEKWASQGIWIISRGDDRYPKRLKVRLHSRAPALLFGIGDIGLLARGGLAIVGSRNADEAASLFTNILAERCAKEGIAVISGDAKGIDREAMTTALDVGGTAIGVLPEGIAKPSMKREYRKPLQEGRLVLLSDLSPDATWSVANAMNRNKYIYALSDWACVVASSTEGGTWSGATENLKHGWVKLFVRSDQPMPPGNRALLERGAFSLDSTVLASHTPLKDYLNAAQFGSLFPAPTEDATHGVGMNRIQHATPSSEAPTPDLFDIVWPHVAAALKKPKTPAELASSFNVTKTQMDHWLKHALKEKRVKKLTKPVRYVVNSQAPLKF